MFDSILEDIEAIFGSVTWKNNKIPTFPDNYQGTIGKDVYEYARVNVLPSSSWNYAFAGHKGINGLVAIKIFVKAGSGQRRTMEIAELIDSVLENKVLTNGTKLGTSYLQIEGLDPMNKSLYSASYIIPFTKYGE